MKGFDFSLQQIICSKVPCRASFVNRLIVLLGYRLEQQILEGWKILEEKTIKHFIF